MHPDRSRRRPGSAARGVIAVELALVLGVFLLFVVGTVEIARYLFVLNTAQEVTRRAARAAAVTDFTDKEAMKALRFQALFRDSDGALPLLPELTPDRLRFEYLALAADGTLAPATPAPTCPEENRANCLADPNGAACVRFVRVSICANDSGACTRLPYSTFTGIFPEVTALSVPVSSTVVRAESLGQRPGTSSCP